MKRYITQLSVQHNRHTFSNVKSCGDNNNIPQAHNRAVRQASELPEEQNPERIPKESRTTDRDGNITQYTAYLPYGELLVDEHSSSEDMPYKFNGKELDEETGLYYYGARYMQPIASIWYGIDPLTEKYTIEGNIIQIKNSSGYDFIIVNLSDAAFKRDLSFYNKLKSLFYKKLNK